MQQMNCLGKLGINDVRTCFINAKTSRRFYCFPLLPFKCSHLFFGSQTKSMQKYRRLYLNCAMNVKCPFPLVQLLFK
uniref:Ovule protein n=1 Tax=Ascaris lumbricoides TaxID=6252 RepID=A0A0M3HTQ1_ASCLU